MKITIKLIFTMLIAAFLLMNCGSKRCVTGNKADAANGASCVDSKCQSAKYKSGYRQGSGDSISKVCIFDADNCKGSTLPSEIADPSKKVVLEDGTCAEW